MSKIECVYKALINASNQISAQKCALYNVISIRDCDYSLLSNEDKKQADFLDIIERETDNALNLIKSIIYN